MRPANDVADIPGAFSTTTLDPSLLGVFASKAIAWVRRITPELGRGTLGRDELGAEPYLSAGQAAAPEHGSADMPVRRWLGLAGARSALSARVRMGLRRTGLSVRLSPTT